MSYCKRCRRQIIWIETPAGKKMPCDPNPVRFWHNPDGHGRIVTTDGVVIACDLTGDRHDATGFAYVPHWATCAAGKKHKPDSGQALEKDAGTPPGDTLAVCWDCLPKVVESFPRFHIRQVDQTLHSGQCAICRKKRHLSRYRKTPREKTQTGK